MWLLHTNSMTLSEHIGSSIPPYAILSHRWTKDEVSFQQIFHGTYDKFSHGWAKVLDACHNAKERRIDWIWIDTCCIDRTSSRELSEAINSMFAWYRDAVECYAFLDDVSHTWRSDNGLFRASDWFQRGWTLQELLAPREVIFYGKDKDNRQYIDTRSNLEEQISLACGIDVEHLRGADSIRSASIARRMSWASRRQTTVSEDAAYGLLGIFDVNLPLLYGEGAASAFRRLQLAIIAQSDDDSIFAWGSKSKHSLDSMLASSPQDFQHAGDFHNGPYHGLPLTQANMHTILHVSERATTLLTLMLGNVSNPDKDEVRLGCIYQPKDMTPHAVFLALERAEDGRLYRAGVLTRSTRGWRLPGSAIQRLFFYPEQTSISARPYSAVAHQNQSRLKHDRLIRYADHFRSASWLRASLVMFVFVQAIRGRFTCSGEEGQGCGAAVFVTLLILIMRDLSFSVGQFWTLVIAYFVWTGTHSFSWSSNAEKEHRSMLSYGAHGYMGR